jgi:hypothetical protein
MPVSVAVDWMRNQSGILEDRNLYQAVLQGVIDLLLATILKASLSNLFGN